MIALPVIVLLVTRSAIGETAATAEVNTVVNAVSLAPKIFTVSAGNVQLLVSILVVSVRLSVVHGLSIKIGSCSTPSESNALFIGVTDAL